MRAELPDHTLLQYAILAEGLLCCQGVTRSRLSVRWPHAVSGYPTSRCQAVICLPQRRHSRRPTLLVSGGTGDRGERWWPPNDAIAVNRLLGYENRVAMAKRQSHAPRETPHEEIYRLFQWRPKEQAIVSPDWEQSQPGNSVCLPSATPDSGNFPEGARIALTDRIGPLTIEEVDSGRLSPGRCREPWRVAP